MTVVGGNNNNSNNNGDKDGNPLWNDHHRFRPSAQARQVFLPSVYRYSCQGMFSVSTDTPGSVGTCRGLQSNMEHLMDFPLASSPQAAIDQFTSAATATATQEDAMLMDESSSNPSASSDHSGVVDDHSHHSEAVQALLEDSQANPALVYRHNPKQQQQQQQNKKNSSSPLVQASDKKEDGDKSPSNDDMAVDANAVDDLFYPSSSSSSTAIVYESWQAYGSTEVECLQLTHVPTGQTRIVAVAPYNHALVSHRQVDLANDTSVTCVQVGLQQKIMFLLESSAATSSQTNGQANTGTNDWNAQPQLTGDNDNKEQNENALTSSANNNNRRSFFGPFTAALSNLFPPSPNGTAESSSVWPRWSQAAWHWGIRTHAFGLKIGSQLQSNTVWLYEHGGDWAHRTVSTGQRIAAHVPKTAHAVAHKALELWEAQQQQQSNEDASSSDKKPKDPPHNSK